jgi:hypothetical protein
MHARELANGMADLTRSGDENTNRGDRMRVLVLLLMASLAQAQSGMANGLYYEVAGSGHPLVFIHGGRLDSRMRDDQFAADAKSYMEKPAEFDRAVLSFLHSQ